MIAYAKEQLPYEACGLIAGTENGEERIIKNVYFLTNVEASGENLEIHPGERNAGN